MVFKRTVLRVIMFLTVAVSYARGLPGLIDAKGYQKQIAPKLTANEAALFKSVYTLDEGKGFFVLDKGAAEMAVTALKPVIARSGYSVSLSDRVIMRMGYWGINPYLITFLIAMLPIIELRGAIPAGILLFHLPSFLVILLSVLGNMVPIIFILFLLKYVERIVRKVPFFNMLLDKIFARTMAKSDAVKKYEELGLMFFVGIPLPMTGAWTGSLLAYVLKLSYMKSLLYIFLGVLLSAFIMGIFTFFGIWGLIIGISLLVLITVGNAWYEKSKK